MNKPTETQLLLMGVTSKFVDTFLQIEADSNEAPAEWVMGGEAAIRRTVAAIGITEIFERMLAETRIARKGRKDE